MIYKFQENSTILVQEILKRESARGYTGVGLINPLLKKILLATFRAHQ